MNRNYSIDVLRIISAIAVIMIHVVTSPVYNSANVINTSVENNLELIKDLMLWSVPVFFMITGYCLLKKQECTYKYCFSHVFKYLEVLFSVGLFYSLMEEIFTAKTINYTLVIKSVLNVISGNLWDHMWFVYSIIGVYLVMPVIHSFMQQGAKNVCILTGLLFFFTIFCPAINKWLPIGIDFPFGGYLFYVCLGGAIAKCRIKKELLYFCCLSGGLSIMCMVTVAGTHSFGYRDMLVCLIAMSIFLIVNKIDIKPNKLILKISECTWGIYLIHPFFINIAIKLLKIDLLTSLPYVKLSVFALIVSIISFITTYMLRKIPFIKKLF